MSHSTIPPDLREHLLRQLVYLDENKYDLEEKWAVGAYSEKREMLSFIRQYTETLEKIVAGPPDGALDACVFIGSKVLIRFEEEADQAFFTIVFPDEVHLEQNCISFISPLGRGLIFAKRNDVVPISSPQGTYNVKILEHEHVRTFDVGRRAHLQTGDEYT